MKSALGVSVITLIVLTGSALPTFGLMGQSGVSLDLFGNGTWGYSVPTPGGPIGDSGTLTSSVGINPLSGVSCPVLTYYLPTTAITGDVIVLGRDGQIEELLRFPTDGSGAPTNQMIVFSRADDAVVTPADVPEFPSAPGATTVTRSATLAIYSTSAPKAGYLYFGSCPGTSYHLGLPEVPEPATLSMLLVGLAGMLYRRPRKA